MNVKKRLRKHSSHIADIDTELSTLSNMVAELLEREGVELKSADPHPEPSPAKADHPDEPRHPADEEAKEAAIWDAVLAFLDETCSEVAGELRNAVAHERYERAYKWELAEATLDEFKGDLIDRFPEASLAAERADESEARMTNEVRSELRGRRDGGGDLLGGARNEP